MNIFEKLALPHPLFQNVGRLALPSPNVNISWSVIQEVVAYDGLVFNHSRTCMRDHLP